MEQKPLKVAWVSDEVCPARDALEKFLMAVTNMSTLTELWQFTKHKGSDFLHNTDVWKEYFKTYDVVAGTFPPEALEALYMSIGYFENRPNAMRCRWVLMPGYDNNGFLRWVELY